MDRQPTEEFVQQVALVVQADEGAERKALIGRQQDCRNSGGHTQAEGQYSNQRVVIEQYAGENAKRLNPPRPGPEDGAREIVTRGRWTAALYQAGWHKRREPALVLHSEQEPGNRAYQHGKRRDQDVPPRRTHCSRQFAPEK